MIDGNPSGTAEALRAPSRPIFVIGVPRSGTTVVFNCFAARPDVAWFPQHLNRVPSWPSVTLLARLADRFPSARKSIQRSDHSRRWREKARIGPVEAYPIWEHYAGSKFLYESLLGVRPTADESAGLRRLVRKLQRYQGKDRFATKITGPARIGFLTGAFPDAIFVNVIRDGRAVVAVADQGRLLQGHLARDLQLLGGGARRRRPRSLADAREAAAGARRVAMAGADPGGPGRSEGARTRSLCRGPL